MAPKRRRLTQRARAAARTATITRKKNKRDARAGCAKDLNRLAQEIGVNFRISVRLPTSAAVERLVRILEGRELEPEQTQRLDGPFSLIPGRPPGFNDKSGTFQMKLGFDPV